VRCFVQQQRTAASAVIGKLRFVPIGITISRFSNWPRSQIIGPKRERELCARSAPGRLLPAPAASHPRDYRRIPDPVSSLLPASRLQAAVSLALSCVNESRVCRESTPELSEHGDESAGGAEAGSAREARTGRREVKQNASDKVRSTYEVLKTLRRYTPLSHNAVAL